MIIHIDSEEEVGEVCRRSKLGVKGRLKKLFAILGEITPIVEDDDITNLGAEQQYLKVKISAIGILLTLVDTHQPFSIQHNHTVEIQRLLVRNFVISSIHPLRTSSHAAHKVAAKHRIQQS